MGSHDQNECSFESMENVDVKNTLVKNEEGWMSACGYMSFLVGGDYFAHGGGNNPNPNFRTTKNGVPGVQSS